MYSLLLQFLEQDQANLIICMLLTIPLSYILRLISHKYLFLLVSMSITIAFQSWLFPTQKYFLWIQQQVVYLLIMFAPRKHVGHYVLVESFLALGAVQIRRIYISYGVNGVDITGIFMMQLFVWVGMAYNYQNGLDITRLGDSARQRVIIQRPSYITYIGCVNFLPACLIGPVYQYRHYQDYLNRVNDYKQIPNPLKAMGNELGIFLATLIVYVLTLRFEIEHVLTESFAQSPLYEKFIYIVLNIFNIELKYISAWSLGMIGMIASGFTYNPKENRKNSTGQVLQYNFGRIRTTDFRKFYLQSSIKVKAQGWNMPIQNALKKYIYEQIYNPLHTFRNQKQRKSTMNKAQLATLMTSALWHGFYQGYFITFFHWTLCVQINAAFYKFRIQNAWLKQNWDNWKIFQILQNAVWTFYIMYLGMAIHLMVWKNIKIYLIQTYALPYILLWIVFILVTQFHILEGKKEKKAQQIKQN